MHSQDGAIARNVRLYPLYTGAGRFHCSAAVFYLFFGEFLTLEGLLQLEAIYYVAYVLLEVPSGYFSDRVGRKPTLVISASALVLSFLLFSIGSTLAVFALAQILNAVGWTFRSGTDTTLHYDSLVSLGREHEYAAREAIAARNALAVAAIAAAVGGALGMIALRAAYVATFLGTFVPLTLVLFMREPPVHSTDPEQVPGFARQLRVCAGLLRRPALGWLSAFFVVMYVLQHVPYMFYQPYIAALLGEVQATPLVAGLHTAVALLIGAWAGAKSIRVRDQLGVRPALLGAMAVQALLIGIMSLALNPIVAALVLLRSLQPALAGVILNAEITPQVPRAQRATYHSLQNLLGRLLFSSTLLALSLVAGAGDPNDPGSVQSMLSVCSLLGAFCLICLALTRQRLEPDGPN